MDDRVVDEVYEDLDDRVAIREDARQILVDRRDELEALLTRVRREDVDELREAGLGDDEILDVCQVTAYYGYVNRLAMGLGVELES